MYKYIFYFLLLFNFSCHKQNVNKCNHLAKKFLSDINVEQNIMYNFINYDDYICKSNIVINDKTFVLNCDVNFNNCELHKKD